MHTLWRIELFGGLTARGCDRVVDRFQTQKTGALLAYLALPVGRIYPRAVLIEQFWPGAEPKAGRASLRSALASLRRQLEPPGTAKGSVLVTTYAAVRLHPNAAVTDVAEFEAALRAAGKADVAMDKIAPLARAIALYRGELLSGYYEEWILPEQRRLASAYLTALRQLMRLYEQADDLNSALEMAIRAVREDPLDEPTARTLIRLHIAKGHPSAALQEYAELERRLHEDLGQSPSLQTRKLVAAVQAKVPPISPQRPAKTPVVTTAQPTPASDTTRPITSLPSPLRLPGSHTRFFGRETEIAQLQELLSPLQGGSSRTPDHSRLVTLTGPGGSGKTRLALKVAEGLQENFGGALWFIPLADVMEASHLPDAILNGLQLPRSSETAPMNQIITTLAMQPSMLILDNFEQLAETGAEIVSALRDRVPRLTLLLTSRQIVGLAGEQEFPVSPLPVPTATGTPERLLEFPSVRLFVDRAQERRPDFQITPRNAAILARLVERLEGIPLAIELAAPWTQVQTPFQILERMTRRFEILVNTRKDLLERHRTLYAAIEWSYRLLAPDLRRFFARLSCFRGGWTLEAAAQVCEEPNALDLLRQLRERSLLLAHESGETMRYRFLETLREFAAEHLPPETAIALAQRHADYFRSLADRTGTRWQGKPHALWLECMGSELENLRAALDVMRESGQAKEYLQFCVAISNFWATRDYNEEGNAHLSRALAAYPEHDALRADALRAQAQLDNWATTETQLARLQESLALFQQHGNLPDAVATILLLSETATVLGEYTRAYDYLMDGLRCLEAQDDPRRRAQILHKLGCLCADQGRFEEARDYFTRSLMLNREMGHQHGVGMDLLNLGNLALMNGDWKRGWAEYQASLEQFQAIGNRLGEAVVLTLLGKAAVGLGEFSEAQELYQKSLRLHRELHTGVYECMALTSLGELCFQREEWDAAWDWYRQSLTLLRNIKSPREIANTLEGIAELAQTWGQAELSVRWFGAVRALRAQHGLAPSIRNFDFCLLSLRRSLGETEFVAAWDAGCALTWEQAVNEVFAPTGMPPASRSHR